MSKLLKGMAIGVVVMGTFLVSPVAGAKAVCDIGYTGPDSDNMCTTTTRYVCTVENDNQVIIKDTNNQDATSGTVELEYGEGGYATSGSVTNENGTTFDFVIENGNYEEPDICTVTASVPATETPETPVTPVQPTVKGTGAVAALPVTGGDTSGMTLVTVASIVGGLALLSVLAALAYTRHANR